MSIIFFNITSVILIHAKKISQKLIFSVTFEIFTVFIASNKVKETFTLFTDFYEN
jgi:hypothetical protein